MTTPTFGYTRLDKIYDAGSSIIHRARRDRDGLPVILKKLRGPYPSAARVARFRREFEITQGLDGAGCARAVAFENDDGTPVLVLEDHGGDALGKLLSRGRLPLESFLEVAVRMTDALGQIHDRNVIHKDVNPSNIIWNPTRDQLGFIDFGLASTLSRETQAVRRANVVEGTLPYISPEQTGRMNRSLDRRTDFYSLGCTFYEMLVGRPPFVASDPMELIHAHIARTPVAPHLIEPLVPRAVSDVVMKLIAKAAEERYQTCAGLKADHRPPR